MVLICASGATASIRSTLIAVHCRIPQAGSLDHRSPRRRKMIITPTSPISTRAPWATIKRGGTATGMGKPDYTLEQWAKRVAVRQQIYRDALAAEERAHTEAVRAHNALMDVLHLVPVHPPIDDEMGG